MVFNPNDPQYRTCCCHVKTCTIVIGVLFALRLIGELISAIVDRYNSGEQTSIAYVIGASVAFAIGAIVVILLFIGVAKEHHLFLIPYLILQIITVLLMCLGVLLYILEVTGAYRSESSQRLYTRDKNTGHDGRRTSAIIAIILYVITVAFAIWFFIVVLKCYRFFRDKRRQGFVMASPAVAYHA